jgi:hypothetical protein
MAKDERDLLEVLGHELDLLEKGWYRRSSVAGGGWRPSFLFEDSPTCVNHACQENPRPCADCALTQLVPPERRSEKFPCRHIPLDASGQTLDSLYRQCDQQEVEETAGTWLRATIEQFEEDRRTHLRLPDGNARLPLNAEATGGVPLFQKLHPKCANPACPAAFHWLAGGKFFRFRPNRDSSPDRRGARHYWLCERCSPAWKLVEEEDRGVVLKLHWRELPIAIAAGEDS